MIGLIIAGCIVWVLGAMFRCVYLFIEYDQAGWHGERQSIKAKLGGVTEAEYLCLVPILSIAWPVLYLTNLGSAIGKIIDHKAKAMAKKAMSELTPEQVEYIKDQIKAGEL